MENTFEEVTEVYAGAKLTDDFEDTGNRILEKYGFRIEFGDHQFMIRFVYRHRISDEEAEEERQDLISNGYTGKRLEDEMARFNPMYSAYACVAFDEEHTGRIIDVHLEHGFDQTAYYDPEYDSPMTDEEYDLGIQVVEEVLNAVVIL